jgi:3-oxoacyl-[acyl-carrier-protein] synthase III
MFLDNLVGVGHSFCADSFINYRVAVDKGRLRPGDHYVMTALGAGATWAAMVLQYQQPKRRLT